jgi:hypothetical protein
VLELYRQTIHRRNSVRQVALEMTGVEKSAIGRLRSGASRPAELKGKTLHGIESYMGTLTAT